MNATGERMRHNDRVARINLENGPIVSSELSETNDKQNIEGWNDDAMLRQSEPLLR